MAVNAAAHYQLRRVIADANRARQQQQAADLVIEQLERDEAELEAEWHEQQAEIAWSNRAVRDATRELNYGHESGSCNCFSCGTFKSEPAAVCTVCGDDPVSHNGDRHEFNRAHGYAA